MKNSFHCAQKLHHRKKSTPLLPSQKCGGGASNTAQLSTNTPELLPLPPRQNGVPAAGSGGGVLGTNHNHHHHHSKQAVPLILPPSSPRCGGGVLPPDRKPPPKAWGAKLHKMKFTK